MAGLPSFDPESVEGFEWDDGNTTKNALRHDVTPAEAEEVFFHTPLVLLPDDQHSQRETRFLAHGVATAGRQLTVAFTIRGKRIRVMSARDMSRKERRAYAKAS